MTLPEEAEFWAKIGTSEDVEILVGQDGDRRSRELVSDGARAIRTQILSHLKVSVVRDTNELRCAAFLRGAIGRVNEKHPMVWSKPLDEMRKASEGTRTTIGWYVAKHREGVRAQSRCRRAYWGLLG